MVFSINSASRLSGGWGVHWDTDDFLRAHVAVKESGKFNFEGCKIPIPTSIRHDRIEEALEGTVSPKEQRVLNLLKYGMPIDCKPNFGTKKKH